MLPSCSLKVLDSTTIRYRAGDAAIDFKRQIDAPDDESAAYLVGRARRNDPPLLDMALLRVDDLPTDRMLRLSVKSPEELVEPQCRCGRLSGQGRAKRYHAAGPHLQQSIQRKTAAAGRYSRARQSSKLRKYCQRLTHDASTLGGNSGSAVIEVDTGEVVALHFAGEYLKANYAVPMYELARDSRVASRLNFEGTHPPTNDWAPAWGAVERAKDPAIPQRLHRRKKAVVVDPDYGNRPDTIRASSRPSTCRCLASARRWNRTPHACDPMRRRTAIRSNSLTIITAST